MNEFHIIENEHAGRLKVAWIKAYRAETGLGLPQCNAAYERFHPFDEKLESIKRAEAKRLFTLDLVLSILSGDSRSENDTNASWVVERAQAISAECERKGLL